VCVCVCVRTLLWITYRMDRDADGPINKYGRIFMS